jgi:hypothetical protein
MERFLGRQIPCARTFVNACHGSKIPFRLFLHFCKFGRIGMLGDAPSLLEHLKSNFESNQLGKCSLTVRPKVTACYRDRFVRVLFRSRSLIIPFAYR